MAFFANSLNVLLHFPAIILPLTRPLLISILFYFMCVSMCVYDFTYLKTLLFLLNFVIAALDTYFMVIEIKIFLKLD